MMDSTELIGQMPDEVVPQLTVVDEEEGLHSVPLFSTV